MSGGAEEGEAPLSIEVVRHLTRILTEILNRLEGHLANGAPPPVTPLNPAFFDPSLQTVAPLVEAARVEEAPVPMAPEGASGVVAQAPPSSPREAPFAHLIDKAAGATGLPTELIRAVIQTESSFDPNARSRVGAQGLMQLMPGTAKEMGVDNPFDPEQNIMGGSRYLKKLMDRYHGQQELALAAYNWGSGNLERHPERMPTETKNYIAKIGRLLDGGAVATRQA